MVGAQIGRYKILKLLGAGGMGAVYLAEHEDLRRRVALKVLHANLAAQPALVARFLNEARAATAVESPAFVSVFDWDRTAEGAPYFVMELLDGQSLDQRIDAGVLPLDEALRIAGETAAALALVHARGIIHRDLKPANLFLATDASLPGVTRLKVLDFGVAKLSAELGVEGSNTRTGQMLGTPTYMAPEQCLGSKEIDPRADIYALGAVLFEMVCGRPPFVATGFGELINMHINVAPPRASASRADLPAELDAIIVRALAKSPDDRQQSMQQVGAELAEVRRRLGKRAAPTVASESAFTEEATKRTEPAQRSPSARVIVATPSSVGTVPPVAMATSVGAARQALRPRRSDWLAALAGLVVVAAGFALVRARARRPEPPQAEAVSPAARTAETVAVPAAVAAVAEAPPPVRSEVHVRVETTPPGASVRTVPDDEDLGVTPLVLARAPGTELPIRIVLPGFRGALRTLRFDEAATEEVRLEKAAAPHDREGPYRPPSRL